MRFLGYKAPVSLTALALFSLASGHAVRAQDDLDTDIPDVLVPVTPDKPAETTPAAPTTPATTEKADSAAAENAEAPALETKADSANADADNITIPTRGVGTIAARRGRTQAQPPHNARRYNAECDARNDTAH